MPGSACKIPTTILLFGVGGKVCGAITDKIIGLDEVLKSVTNGIINDKLSVLKKR
jgi:hypothetical protein